MIEKQAFASVSGFTSDNWFMPEHDLLAKLAYGARTIQILEPRSVFYRIHDSNAIHNVPKMVEACNQLVTAAARRISTETLGSRLRCFPLIGGPALWGVKKACRAGLYKDGLSLLLRSLPYVIVAALTRLSVSLLGRRPIEILPVEAPRVGVS